MIRVASILLCTLIFLSACSFSDPQSQVTEVVAEVDGFNVSQEAFEKMYVRHLIASGKNDTPEGRYAYLSKMIDKLVLGKEAKERGVLKDDRIIAKLDLERKKAYRDFFYLDEMETRIPEITEAEVRSAFAKKQKKVFVRQMFFRDMDKAQKFYARLEQGEDFVKLANECFQTPSYDPNAGFIGEISYFSVEDKFAELAYSLDLNEYSKPFRTRWGVYIIRVEFTVNQPLVPESQFTLKSQGVRSQVKLRKQRIAGDNFIDSLMQSTNPQTNEELLLSVQKYIRDLHGKKLSLMQETNKDKVMFNILDSDQVLSRFDGQAVLLSYTLNGENKAVTVNDFSNWLPELLPSEMINRPGASLGRVMRNEVLYELGKQKGYDSDSRVQYDLALRTQLYAADVLMEDLIASARKDTTQIDEQALQSFVESKASYLWNIEYEAIRYPNLNSAQKALEELSANGVQMKGMESQTLTISSKHVQYKMLKDAPLNKWSIGADNDGKIYVYRVTKRLSQKEEFVADSKFRRVFRSFQNIKNYTDSLYNLASVTVDSARFESEMNL